MACRFICWSYLSVSDKKNRRWQHFFNPFHQYSGLTKTSTALPRLAVLVFVNPLYSAISKIYSDTRVI
ncbi:hypothetical protein ELQ20_06815 [Neisseria meningitidis]|nr:hypothetical protein [Neisseria meningitidis]MCG8972525.1 hypothetical protein [Neisseria meningitidis]